MASAQAYNSGLGAEPPAGSRGRAPGQGVRGQSPLNSAAIIWFKIQLLNLEVLLPHAALNKTFMLQPSRKSLKKPTYQQISRWAFWPVGPCVQPNTVNCLNPPPHCVLTIGTCNLGALFKHGSCNFQARISNLQAHLCL